MNESPRKGTRLRGGRRARVEARSPLPRRLWKQRETYDRLRRNLSGDVGSLSRWWAVKRARRTSARHDFDTDETNSLVLSSIERFSSKLIISKVWFFRNGKKIIIILLPVEKRKKTVKEFQRGTHYLHREMKIALAKKYVEEEPREGSTTRST